MKNSKIKIVIAKEKKPINNLNYIRYVTVKLPYVLEFTPYGWRALNRDYLPLGATDTNKDISDYPPSHKTFKADLSNDFLMSLYGGNKVEYKNGKIYRVYLYNSKNAPYLSMDNLRAYQKKFDRLIAAIS